MRFKSGFILKNDYDCFRTYVCSFSEEIKRKIKESDTNYSFGYLSLEEYITYQKLVVLDKQFWDFLTAEETELCKTTIRKRHDELFKLEKQKLLRVFTKWQEIFFSAPYQYLFENLSPVSLGIVLKAIRSRNLISQADLAEMIGVNRKTVILIENGDRYPSFEYIYYFSKIFHIGIDNLISYIT